jgi:hypothetical protein
MFRKIAAGLVIVVGALFGIIALQPSTYRVVRSASIAAAPEKVFAEVNDFRKWDAWSPWARLDPNMKVTFDGPSSGQGAVYSWAGNSDVGEGRMTIIESKPGESIRIRLDFLKPFPSTSDTEFVFKPEAAGTRVDWIMSGTNDFMSKAFCFFMGGMDRTIGPDFEKGLATMKSVVETNK